MGGTLTLCAIALIFCLHGLFPSASADLLLRHRRQETGTSSDQGTADMNGTSSSNTTVGNSDGLPVVPDGSPVTPDGSPVTPDGSPVTPNGPPVIPDYDLPVFPDYDLPVFPDYGSPIMPDGSPVIAGNTEDPTANSGNVPLTTTMDSANPEGKIFDFNGNTGEDSGEVPVLPPPVLPPFDYDLVPDNDGEGVQEQPPPDLPPDYGGVDQLCPHNWCSTSLNPCNSSSVCAMSDDCQSTLCVPRNSSDGGSTWVSEPRTGQSRSQDVDDCDGLILCLNGYCENLSCVCNDGWSGPMCENECTLECEHGYCNYINGQEFCNCEHQYEGDSCERLKPDPEEKARTMTAVLSVALTLVLILAVVIPIVLWRMRVIFVLRLVYYFKEYEDKDGKLYDAYVSMTSTSTAESFVYRSLQPKLEELGFKLYLQARDSPAGDAMSENILTALEKSRRTILIVTSDYVKNEWNRFEYLIAQHETLKLRQRIIPVILEDIEEECVNMDKSLKHILKSIKCLKFPQPKAKSEGDSGTPVINPNTSSYSLQSKDARKLENQENKFWKRLELTMPKKKKEEESSNNAKKIYFQQSTDSQTRMLSREYCELNIAELNEINNEKSHQYHDNNGITFSKEQDINMIGSESKSEKMGEGIKWISNNTNQVNLEF